MLRPTQPGVAPVVARCCLASYRGCRWARRGSRRAARVSSEPLGGQQQVIRVELLEQARREFAEKIRAMSALRSTRLVDALGTIG
jgi:hypothetical protein